MFPRSPWWPESHGRQTVFREEPQAGRLGVVGLYRCNYPSIRGLRPVVDDHFRAMAGLLTRLLTIHGLYQPAWMS